MQRHTTGRWEEERWKKMFEGQCAAIREPRFALDCRQNIAYTSREAQVSQRLPQSSKPVAPRTRLAWRRTPETFVVASGEGIATMKVDTEMPVLEGRLAFMISREMNLHSTNTTYYFTTDESIRYVPFCADFG